MKHIIYAFLAMILFLASCDDGRIYEKELVIPKQGLTLKMTGEITGLDSWPSNYSLVIATFKEDIPMPRVQRSFLARTIMQGVFRPNSQALRPMPTTSNSVSSMPYAIA